MLTIQQTKRKRKNIPMSCNPPTHRFCPCCGGALEKRRLNDHDRLVCGNCRRLLYLNPAVGVAVVVRRGEEILWGRRAGGLYQGAWCLPCGYVEWGEEVREAAAREFREETGLTDRKSTRLNSSHGYISYAVFCL